MLAQGVILVAFIVEDFSNQLAHRPTSTNCWEDHSAEWQQRQIAFGNKRAECGPTALPFSCRERAGRSAKNPTISRAKRSAATACSATRSPSRELPPTYADHTSMLSRRHNGRSVGITHSTEPHQAQ